MQHDAIRGGYVAAHGQHLGNCHDHLPELRGRDD